jgi:CRP/FNR family transcriptional regulator, polysaccharide utilization system transcription regulator
MKTILLIEDNPEMRENTAEILDLARYTVVTAPNGKEGVKIAQQKNPDLIICDIMMPELDGYGVLHMLSMDPETASIPFIFLTAKAEKSDYRKGMSMGADDYLTKPFDDMELLSAVEMRLKKSDRIKTNFTKSLDGLNEFFREAKSLDDLNKLSENRKLKSVRKKETIYNESAFPNSIYFLSKGKVKTARNNEDGKEFITGLYNEGDFFGYLALLEGEAYSDSAYALEDSEICIIPKEDFFALLNNNRDVSARFIKMLSDDINEKEERLIKLAYNSVRKRVAEALLMLETHYSDKKNEEPFSMAIAREDLANIVGTASETVIRTLSDFKDEKLIEIKGSRITLMNRDKLQKMKN